MKLTIDSRADALYLHLTEEEVAETRQVAPGVMLDFDAAGDVVGIEMLSLTKHASKADLRRLLFETLDSTTSAREDQAPYPEENS